MADDLWPLPKYSRDPVHQVAVGSAGRASTHGSACVHNVLGFAATQLVERRARVLRYGGVGGRAGSDGTAGAGWPCSWACSVAAPTPGWGRGRRRSARARSTVRRAREPAGRPRRCGSGTCRARAAATSPRSSPSARRYGVSTLIIKSGDGTDCGRSSTRTGLGAARQRAAGCARGSTCTATTRSPRRTSAPQAVHDGADCLMIDAEGEYEGKYVAAQTYITQLRELVGASYPGGAGRLPLRRLPPGVPVLGVPRPRRRAVQRARRCTGWTSARASTPCTRTRTRTTALYRRAIDPLGQVYEPAAGPDRRFRQLSRAYAPPA